MDAAWLRYAETRARELEVADTAGFSASAHRWVQCICAQASWLADASTVVVNRPSQVVEELGGLRHIPAGKQPDAEPGALGPAAHAGGGAFSGGDTAFRDAARRIRQRLGLPHL